jgi:2-hydroxychromene-2-carboxylate isomerase
MAQARNPTADLTVPRSSEYYGRHEHSGRAGRAAPEYGGNRKALETALTLTSPQFMFDVGSPNAFLSHEAIPRIEQRTGVKFQYVPILLGGIFKATNNKSPAETLAGIKNKPEFQVLETERFVKRFGVKPYTMNPFFPVNTLHLMRAAVAAQFEGVFAKYVDAAFHHMWGEPKKMDDPEVAMKAFTASGLDAAKLFARAQEADVKARLIENTQAAVERGAFGSPTFFVGKEMFFGKEQLREVEELVSAMTCRHCEEGG